MPFSAVFGHHRLISLLKRSIAGGTLPPSLLCVGPSGVGKRLTALAVAQTLNCLALTAKNPEPRTPNPEPRTPNPEVPNPEVPNPDACGVCAACTRIARGVHPDVLFVEPGD